MIDRLFADAKVTGYSFRSISIYDDQLDVHELSLSKNGFHEINNYAVICAVRSILRALLRHLYERLLIIESLVLSSDNLICQKIYIVVGNRSLDIPDKVFILTALKTLKVYLELYEINPLKLSISLTIASSSPFLAARTMQIISFM